MKKAILYMRVNTRLRTIESGQSLAGQWENLKKYCGQKGVEVVKFFQEVNSTKKQEK